MKSIKKLITATAFLTIVIFLAVTASADSLSTYKIIRLTLRVGSESEIEESHRTIVKQAVNEVDKKPTFDLVYRGY